MSTQQYDCFVPWLDERPLINAVASSERECHVNLGLLDLSDEELQRVVIHSAKITLDLQAKGEQNK